MRLESNNIECPRYGGTRFAPACVVFDRYRRCRKTCVNLAEHVKGEENFVKKAVKLYAKRGKKETLFLSIKFAGKGVLDESLQCKTRGCKFIGKSVRGLKSHHTRTHKRRTLL